MSEFTCWFFCHLFSYLGKQWAADRIHFSEMMEPPQTWAALVVCRPMGGRGVSQPCITGKMLFSAGHFWKNKAETKPCNEGKIILQIRFSDGPTWTSTCQGQAPSAASAPPTILFSCNGGRPHSLPETMIPIVHVHTFLLKKTASRNDLMVSIKYQYTVLSYRWKMNKHGENERSWWRCTTEIRLLTRNAQTNSWKQYFKRHSVVFRLDCSRTDVCETTKTKRFYRTPLNPPALPLQVNSGVLLCFFKFIRILK